MVNSDRKQHRMNEKRKLDDRKQARQSLSINMTAEITSTPDREGRPDLERQSSDNTLTMEHFLETAKIDRETAKMLVKYDKDGNGQFSKAEVATIIMDLRKEHRENEELMLTNTTFKRLLCAMCLMSIFILLAMVGVSYSVAVLLNKTDVNSSGALVASGTNHIVSTDARAEKHSLEINEAGLLCVGREEVESWRQEVTIGRNVLLETFGLNGESSLTRLSGAGVQSIGNDICFHNRAGGKTCWMETSECNTASSEWTSGAIYDYDRNGTRRNRH